MTTSKAARPNTTSGPKSYRSLLADIESTSTPQYSPPCELGTNDAGVAFLEENATKPGVVSLPSGLQYKVLKMGAASSKSPLRTTDCEVHYRGKLIPAEGAAEFDSSIKRGKPATFAPNKVVQGWTIALQLMGVGDKWAVYVPPALAYGDAGRSDEKRGQYIPAGAVLCFELELLAVRGPSKARPVRPVEPPSDGSFEPAKSFDGARAGFVFTSGAFGVGYYKDRAAAPATAAAAAESTTTPSVGEPASSPPDENAETTTGGPSHQGRAPVLGEISGLRANAGQPSGGAPLDSSGLFSRAPAQVETRRAGTPGVSGSRDSSRPATPKSHAKQAGAAALRRATEELAKPKPQVAPPQEQAPPPQPPRELVERLEAVAAAEAYAAAQAAAQDENGGMATGRSTKSTARRRSSSSVEVQQLRDQLAEQKWLTQATVGALEALLLRLRLPTLKHALNDLSLPSDGKKDELASRLIGAMSELTPRDPAAKQEWRGIR